MGISSLRTVCRIVRKNYVSKSIGVRICDSWFDTLFSLGSQPVEAAGFFSSCYKTGILMSRSQNLAGNERVGEKFGLTVYWDVCARNWPCHTKEVLGTVVRPHSQINIPTGLWRYTLWSTLVFQMFLFTPSSRPFLYWWDSRPLLLVRSFLRNSVLQHWFPFMQVSSCRKNASNSQTWTDPLGVRNTRKKARDAVWNTLPRIPINPLNVCNIFLRFVHRIRLVNTPKTRPRLRTVVRERAENWVL